MSPSPNSVAAELFQGGQDRLLGLTPEEGVLALQRGDGLDGVRAADGVDARLRHPEMADLAGLDELLDGACDLFDGHVRVDPVLVEQVDRVGAQPTKRAVDGRTDAVGPAADAGLVAVLVEGEAELGRDDDVLPERLERLADELLVVERAVDPPRCASTDGRWVSASSGSSPAPPSETSTTQPVAAASSSARRTDRPRPGSAPPIAAAPAT
jgi:hypothetical protein